MARFKVGSVFVKDGVVEGTLNAVVGEPDSGLTGITLRVVWTQERGLISFGASSPVKNIGWALSPDLATRAVEALVEFLADKTKKVSFEWSPPIEWGLRHIIGREDAIVKPMLHASEEDARDEFARVQSYDLYARIAAGPWGLVQRAGEDDER